MGGSPQEFQAWIERLEQRRADVSFFQAVRLLLRESRSTLGRHRKPTEEAVRLRTHAGLAFPASQIAQVERIESPQGRPRSGSTAADLSQPPAQAAIEATFFGLFGSQGALPLHYTQLIIDRARHRDVGLKAFLDLFNHRLLSLFYRVWEKYHAPIAFETAQQAGEPDLFTECLMGLVGFGNPALRRRQRVPDHAWLHYAGFMARRGPRGEALAKMLSDHFGLAADVVQLCGEWLRLPVTEQSSLANAGLGRSSGNQLGIDTLAGSQIWSIEHRFRIVLGPLDRQRFDEFLPQTHGLRQLCQWVRTYVGPAFDFDVQVRVQARHVPMARLGGGAGSRLGWNSWLGTWSRGEPADDAVFVDEGLPDRAPVAAAPSMVGA